MTDDKEFRLSRRQALGALGTIGVASAGAGLGTSAFFSDEETFEDNQLVAGALDLKVDWEEHYSDWSDDESEGLTHEVKMSAPSDTGSWVGLPDPADPLIWVHMDDLGAFMDNTSIEAYPDSDDDGIQDDISNFDFCNTGADTPEDLDPTAGLRTENSDTYGESGYYPLVNLDDVKPGDFGELTLSFHLCDNPGYIWLNGDLVEARENGTTEPESKDPDEEGDEDEVSTSLDNDVELLDEIQTKLWYDEDGDNVYEPDGATQEVDVTIVLDRSGSMGGSALSNAKAGAKMLVDALGGAAQASLVSFADDVTLDQGLTSDMSAVKSAIDGLTAGGTTNIEGAVDAAHEELTGNDVSGDITASGGDRDGAKDVMVVLSDGAPNVNGDGDNENDSDFGNFDPADNASAAKGAGIEIYTIGYGSLSTATEGLLEEMASDPKSSHAYLAGEIDIGNVFGQIGQILRGEEAFFEGSLRTLLELLSTDHGIPLDGNRATPFEEVTGDDTDGDGVVDANQALGDNVADNRECFTDATTNALGLAWWLPVDHANEIQTDSVSFDLGFYTEQCRHNDGAGQAPESA